MKKIFCRFWPVITIFLIWFIFSSPYFVKNKAPFSADYQANFFPPWNAYKLYQGPVKNNAMPDIISQIYPWKNLVINSWKINEIPLWNSYSFSGTPLLANYQSAVFSPFNFLFFLLPFIDAWSLLILLQPLLAGLFMYLFARSLSRSKLASFIASVSFMFCGFIVCWMEYGTLVYAILYLPLSLFAVEEYLKTNKNKFLILLSLTVPLSFFSGHFQISLYFLITLIVYIAYKAFIAKNNSSILYLILYAFFGLLMSAPQLLPSIEFYQQSLRSGIFQKNEAIPWQYLATFIAPDFFGNPVTRNDWFGHYAEWNTYIGLIPLILAIYGILNKKINRTFILFIFGVLSLMLAFNGPILNLLIALHIPVLSTSAAGRVIVIFSFLFALLSAFGLDQLIEDLKKFKYRKITILLLFTFLIFILLWLTIYLKLFIPVDKIRIARQNLFLPSLIFLSFCFSILIFLIVSKNSRRKKVSYFIFGTLLVCVISFDMLRFAGKWMPFGFKNLVFANTPIASEFDKNKGYFRSFGAVGGEAIMFYKQQSVEGHDALYIKRYGEFIASLDDGKLKESSRSVVSFPKNGLNTGKAVNLLGIKYIIHKVFDGKNIWAFPYWNYPDGQFKRLYSDGVYEIYENQSVFPRAFLVSDYRVVSDSQNILNEMFSSDVNLAKTVLLEEDPKLNRKKDFIGSARITKYTPNHVEIKTNSSEDSLLFLSDSFYNGWRTEVDGKNVKIYRTDYAFKAVVVKKGKHIVKFIYDPQSFKTGIILAALGIIGGLGFCFIPKTSIR